MKNTIKEYRAKIDHILTVLTEHKYDEHHPPMYDRWNYRKIRGNRIFLVSLNFKTARTEVSIIKIVQ